MNPLYFRGFILVSDRFKLILIFLVSHRKLTLQLLTYPSLMRGKRLLTSPTPSCLLVSAFSTGNLKNKLQNCSPSCTLYPLMFGSTCCLPTFSCLFCCLFLPGRQGFIFSTLFAVPGSARMSGTTRTLAMIRRQSWSTSSVCTTHCGSLLGLLCSRAVTSFQGKKQLCDNGSWDAIKDNKRPMILSGMLSMSSHDKITSDLNMHN